MKRFFFSVAMLLCCGAAYAFHHDAASPAARAAGGDIPIPSDAVNATFSPDSSMVAFTIGGDLYLASAYSSTPQHITCDGTDTVTNGYASWVYYEEIFGRPSKYRAFWWSPDSRHLAFYRFDNSSVPLFPIYSPFGQDGKVTWTAYPKAGEPNPRVRIGIATLQEAPGCVAGHVVWADFDEEEDQYFGTPFWGPDSKTLYVPREPRIQQDLELYAVDASDGKSRLTYTEHSDTWLDWMDGALFTSKGMYIARCVEGDWQQIYFLPYGEKRLQKLSDGPNWRVNLLEADEKTGTVYFTAHRDYTYKAALYSLDRKGNVTALTDPAFNVSDVAFDADLKHFECSLSAFDTPTRKWRCETARAASAWKARRMAASGGRRSMADPAIARSSVLLSDSCPEGFEAEDYALPRIITLELESGFTVPGMITLPKDFDPSRKYPLHMEIYGGPDTPYVRERWKAPNRENQWWSEHGIIHAVVDSRVAGHNGRSGEAASFRDVVTAPVEDFCQWARYFASLPYVDGSRIGVEGFSFGGTMTAMLVMTHPELFCCGIAGGGVYDWTFYDTHYTERFMMTPQANPEGYLAASVLRVAETLPSGRIPLMLTHGTGDDNVHFQNTLRLVDVLQRRGVLFDLMIYPDGKHGYRGGQHEHDLQESREFWSRHLLGK